MPRTNIEVPDAAWFKSSYSGGNETECVEIAITAVGTSVRDSKQPYVRRLEVHSMTWADFIGSVRDGQLG